jgi:activator of HSP90 ATPase
MIRQKIAFDAPADMVYDALTESEKFAEFTGAYADISTEEGGRFTCSGPNVLGRNLELVPNRRIVQAWRVFNWPAGVYSIVRFDLEEKEGRTWLTLEQTGVPEELAPHVDGGWGEKYWGPLAHYLKAKSSL